MCNIAIRLNDILKSLFSIDIEVMEKADLDKPLMGKIFKLEARDLVYLYLSIEKEFGISIHFSDIENQKFKTINGIISIIEKQK